MSYSRNFEREADNNALVFLDANHIERHYFVDLMDRLTYQAECNELLIGSHLKEKWTLKKSASSQSSSSVGAASQNSSTSSSISLAEGEDQDDSPRWLDVDEHKAQCDKLLAEHKKSFFDKKLMGYFASHPETNERTIKFKQQPVTPQH
jgi:Zn-dependent protease with chaperone function